MKKLLKKYSPIIWVAMLGITLIKIGILIENLPDEGQLLVTCTSTIVFILCILAFTHAVIFSTNKLTSRIFAALGVLLIAVDYLAYLVFVIDLNMFAPNFWCDTGIICLLLSAQFNNK
jgi:hypothetical protein